MDELEIRVLESPSPEVVAKLKDFSDKNWGAHAESDIENNKLNFYDIPKYWIVGYLGDEIVGLLEIFLREISFEENLLKMAGIGGVVTAKERRRKGVMKKILNYTFETVLPKYDLDLAMLCTEIPKLGGLYSTVGFVPLARPYYFLNKNGVERQDPDGMIVALKSPEVVRDILSSESKLFVGRSNF